MCTWPNPAQDSIFKWTWDELCAPHNLGNLLQQLFLQVNAYSWLTLTGLYPPTDCSIGVGANAANEAEWHPGQQQQQQQRW